MQVSDISVDSKRRLIRYAKATRQCETERRVIRDRDGGMLERSPSLPTLKEYFDARDGLVNCPEPDIKTLVHQIQIERIDEVMVDETKTELDVIAADHHVMLADNELIHLGHKFRVEQEARVQPHCRRRDGRRSRTAARRRRHN